MPALAALIVTLGLVCPSAADDRTCALRTPVLTEVGEVARVAIVLDCTGGGSVVASGTALIVGATAYGPRFAGTVETILDAAPGIPAPDDPKRMLIADDHAKHVDFPVAEVTVTAETMTKKIVFEIPAKKLVGMENWVFAAWHAEAREPCDQHDKFERPGCQDYGYVIAFNDWEGPVLAYPGFVIVKALDPMGHPHEVPRWIVERFR